MITRALQYSEWQAYFDEASKHFEEVEVRIDILDDDLGDQVEAAWLPLRGMSYDAKGDAFDVMTGELDHRVPRPTIISVCEEGGELQAVEIVSEREAKQIFTVRAAA